MFNCYYSNLIFIKSNIMGYGVIVFIYDILIIKPAT